MSVELGKLEQLISDLDDMRNHEATPQHLVVSISDHRHTLQDAVTELKRLHGITS